MNRRTFVKSSLGVAASLAAGKIADAADAAGPAPPAADMPAPPTAAHERVPMGKLCSEEVSRLMLGGNMINGYLHCRDLKYVAGLSRAYNTDAKSLETLALAEEHGINTINMNNPPRGMSLLKEHRRRGGKMKWLICPTGVDPETKDFEDVVKGLVDDGTEFVYLIGNLADALVAQGKIDVIAKVMDIIKETGVPCGVGAHGLRTIELCEEQKVPADFYVKTLHHHKYPTAPKQDQLTGTHAEVPGYWCSEPERTIEVMKTVTKPWIAFKVMAAGAIPPQDGFQYAFQNGADFVLAGMYDFQITANTLIANEVLTGITARARPWFG